MNTQEMYNAINKGVPSYEIIELSIETLLNQCASNRQLFENEISLLRKLYYEDITRIVKWNKAYADFLKGFRIITNYKNSQTNIFISPKTYLEVIKKALNVNNTSIDFNDRTLSIELMTKIKELKSITSVEELKTKFPVIYEDYQLSFTSYAKIKAYERKHKNDSDQQQVQNTIDEQFTHYRLYGLDTNFNSFINKQSEMYRRFVTQRTFVEGHTNRMTIDFSMFTGLDKEKFELYLADKYLTKAQESQDEQIKQECLYYVTTYIRETKISCISIQNDEGKNISFKSILKRYKRILKGNPTLRPIDEERSHFENYHYKHVINHVKKYFFTDVNWQIVPPGTQEEQDKTVISSLNRKYNYLSPEERKKIILEKYAVYERKKAFFENSGYIYKIFGINAFDGYIAYFYPNGEVLMEKFFDDYANCIPCVDEAIYNIHITDFETLSKFDKITLIKNQRCKRIIHRGNWEERGQLILSKPITDDSTQIVQEEIKRLNLKFKSSNN